MIALLGLPGVGKSTLATHLATALNGVALLEPEETDWPAFVREPHRNGSFTALSWFRSQRVPLYYLAQSLSQKGTPAVLDSYYDKWCIEWLGAEGVEWLIPRRDPYFAAATQMAATDARVLPPADVVVFLRINERMWRRQLAERGRRIDQDEAFLSSYQSQQLFLDAAERRAPVDGTKVVVHDRRDIDPNTEALEVANLVRASLNNEET